MKEDNLSLYFTWKLVLRQNITMHPIFLIRFSILIISNKGEIYFVRARYLIVSCIRINFIRFFFWLFNFILFSKKIFSSPSRDILNSMWDKSNWD